MPRKGQIIPQYLHPHVSTYINDNSQFEETVAPAVDGVRSLFVFTSPKGKDGVLLKMKTTTEYLDEYGKPKFAMHGQPALMPYAFLSSGQGEAYCMRVMPADAAYSNVVLIAKVKKELPADGKTTGKLTIKHTAMVNNSLLNKDEFRTISDLLGNSTPDAQGFVTIPLIGVCSMGRGAYGNSYRVRLTSATQMDKENNYKNYTLEVLENESGLKRKEFFQGALSPNAMEGTTSLFLEDRIADPDNGSTNVEAFVNTDGVEAIYEMYKAVAPTSEVTLEEFDIFGGKTKAGTALPNIEVSFDTIAAGLNVNSPEGVGLAAGTEGAFDMTNGETRQEAIDEAFMKAFSGGFDKAIASKRRTPCEVIFDAGYSEEVKRALTALILKRGDAQGYIDAGVLNTQTDVINWATDSSAYADRLISKECQHYLIREPFSGKTVAVTTTYQLALRLPAHIKQTGNQIPFTGERYATLTGSLKNSVKPVIDADDLEVKEKLYENRVNYYECIKEGVHVRGTQSTAQTIWSDLSEENNMAVLLEMKRKLEDLVSSMAYNFAEKEDRIRFTESAERLFSDYIGNKVRTAEVSFDMNPYEEERSILHCYLAVTFRTMAKRGLVEIDINKRV